MTPWVPWEHGPRPVLRVGRARVVAVEEDHPDLQRVRVAFERRGAAAVPGGPAGSEREGQEQQAQAIHFPAQAGFRVGTGDRLLLNTTAVDLGLGTGGYHLVLCRLDPAGDPRLEGRAAGQAALRALGHIMKLRYTPWQFPVLAVEETASPHHGAIASFEDLRQTPVVALSLHSMLGPVAAALRQELGPSRRIAYVMTDGGALPAPLSHLVRLLRRRGMIDAVITAGHAFGGDLEAVGVPGALAAAKAVVGADVVVAGMGPGVVGTGTDLGTTALEQAWISDTAAALGGRPVCALRLGYADPRPRHQGLSSHSAVALGRLACRPATVAVPRLDGGARLAQLQEQLKRCGIRDRHRVVVVEEARRVLGWLEEDPELAAACTTMGRGFAEEPAFFEAAAAAGLAAARLAAGEPLGPDGPGGS